MAGTVRLGRRVLAMVTAALVVASLWLVFAETAGAEGLGSPAECETDVQASGGDDLQQFTADEGEIVTGVCIRSGTNMFTDGHSGVLGNGTYEKGCYSVSGVGTQTVTVTRLGDGPKCQQLSHVDVLVDEKPPPSGWACVDGEVVFIDDASEFEGELDDTKEAAEKDPNCVDEPEVGALVLVTVTGQCVTDGTEGIGQLTVEMSVDGAATVVIEDGEGAVVGTVTESTTITVPEGDTYSWEATPGEDFVFPVDFDASDEVTIPTCSQTEVLASVLVTVTGQCVLDGTEGIGRITVDMSVDGAATVVIEDGEGAVVGTVTESTTITVPEGDAYSWEATPGEGFEFPVDFDATGEVQIAMCSEGEVLPLTGLHSEAMAAIALMLLGLGMSVVVIGRTARES